MKEVIILITLGCLAVILIVGLGISLMDDRTPEEKEDENWRKLIGDSI